MERIGKEIYFDSRQEQIIYKELTNFILSFYTTESELRMLLNNIKFVKETDESDFNGFQKEIQAILYLIPLEYPKLKIVYSDYKENKENNLISFIIRNVYGIILNRFKENEIIKKN